MNDWVNGSVSVITEPKRKFKAEKDNFYDFFAKHMGRPPHDAFFKTLPMHSLCGEACKAIVAAALPLKLLMEGNSPPGDLDALYLLAEGACQTIYRG